MISLLLGCSTLALSWILWITIRNFVVRSPLDSIPGPEPASWFKGDFLGYIPLRYMLTNTSGNLGQLFDRHSWGFLDELGTKYGKVVRLTGLLGVTHPQLVFLRVTLTNRYVAQNALRFRPQSSASNHSQRSGELRHTRVVDGVRIGFLIYVKRTYHEISRSVKATLGEGLFGVHGEYFS